ncbi:rhomboid family intramembrane serine protease [Demequina sp. SYSU T00192]|uniref:Rhomboid family intramembrane serine protease n=1 Tax=Demequina litoralis TaxID=3051660 RepID=A0ABT8GAE0_9MICO|nr:rhomboid family intramembrane serine protease [Demequina sp. SYSU T00192]MDN4476110.1 rhomboid family intramembrane serine protease [Demequina sp. SYSU T00192]
MTQDPGAAAPTCPRHPDRVSYVRCQRCGRPACPECQRPAAVGIQCVDCVREARANVRPTVNRLGFTSAHGTPYVTVSLVIANVAAFVYGYMVLGKQLWWARWALLPAAGEATGGIGDEWYRWISSGFVHFSIWHIAMNMLVLWQFGSQLEPILGRLRFGLLYGASLVGSSAAVELLADGGAHGGASGAIFGIIAAYAVVLLKLRLDYRALVTTAGLWLVLGFVIPGISWQGHLGGAVVGALTMLAMLRWVDRRTP